MAEQPQKFAPIFTKPLDTPIKDEAVMSAILEEAVNDCDKETLRDLLIVPPVIGEGKLLFSSGGSINNYKDR